MQDDIQTLEVLTPFEYMYVQNVYFERGVRTEEVSSSLTKCREKIVSVLVFALEYCIKKKSATAKCIPKINTEFIPSAITYLIMLGYGMFYLTCILKFFVTGTPQ